MKSMSKAVDYKKIAHYVESMKTRKPPMVAVSDEQWATALDNYYEQMPEGFTDETTTDEAWTLIYFCAMSFCRGMEYAEVLAGKRTESLYPRY
ncbi:MAG: hypothetical protein AAGB31_15860 [Bdellovibrio sp.]